MTQKKIYLDNSATTKPYDEVIEYMNHINKNIYGNPSSLHIMGFEAEKLVKKARETIAHSLGVSSREIYFTSGGTESINLAIRGYLAANQRKRKHIVTTKIEHPAVLEVYKYLSENGYDVDFTNVDSRGIINLEDLECRLKPDTSLISLILVNNEVGTIQPVDEVVKIKNKICREAVVHVDAVQAYGKIKIFPAKAGIDMMSVSSHKIHGPKGTGAVYIRRDIKVKPIVFGGGQESMLRSGTENVPGICGFGLASEIIMSDMEKNRIKVEKLRDLFVARLKDRFDGCSIISPEGASPYILSVSFYNVRAEVLLHHLEEKNIFISTGSACSSRKKMNSHVLTAMALEKCIIEGAVRFSFSAFNTEEDIQFTVEALSKILPKIQIKHGGKK